MLERVDMKNVNKGKEHPPMRSTRGFIDISPRGGTGPPSLVV